MATTVQIPYLNFGNWPVTSSGIYMPFGYIAVNYDFLPVLYATLVTNQYTNCPKKITVSNFSTATASGLVEETYGLRLVNSGSGNTPDYSYTDGYAIGTVDASGTVMWTGYEPVEFSQFGSAISFLFRTADDENDLPNKIWTSVSEGESIGSGRYLQWKALFSPAPNTSEQDGVVTLSPSGISASGVGSFSASGLLNKSELTGFTSDTSGVNAHVTIDFSDTPKSLIQWSFMSIGADGVVWEIECSDDTVNWTHVSTITMIGTHGINTASWNAVGNYRYWRSRKSSSAQVVGTFYGLEVKEYCPAISPVLHAINLYYYNDDFALTVGTRTPPYNTEAYLPNTNTWEPIVASGIYASGVMVEEGTGIVKLQEFFFTYGSDYGETGNFGYWRLNEGSGTSLTDLVGGETMTISGSPTWSASGNLWSYYLTFNNDGYAYKNASLFNSDDKWTIMAWVYLATGNAGGYIFSAGDDANTSYPAMGCKVEHGGLSVWRKNDSGTEDASSLYGTIPYNQWTHVAFVYDKTNIYFYASGVLINSEAWTTGTLSTEDITIAALRIGGSIDGDKFVGGLGDVRVLSTDLTADQILAVANKTVVNRCVASGHIGSVIDAGRDVPWSKFMHLKTVPSGSLVGGGEGGGGSTVTLINAMGGKTENFCNSYKVTGSDNVEYTLSYTTNKSGWMYEPTGYEGWVVDPVNGYVNGQVSIFYGYGQWYLWDPLMWVWANFDHLENGNDGLDGIDFFDMYMTMMHYLVTPVGGGGGGGGVSESPAGEVIFKFRSADSTESLSSAEWYPAASGSCIIPVEVSGQRYLEWYADLLASPSGVPASPRLSKVMFAFYDDRYQYPLEIPWETCSYSASISASGYQTATLTNSGAPITASGYIGDIITAGDDVIWDFMLFKTTIPTNTNIEFVYRYASASGGEEELSGQSWIPYSHNAFYGTQAMYIEWKATLTAAGALESPVLESVVAVHGGNDLDSFFFPDPSGTIWPSGNQGKLDLTVQASDISHTSIATQGYVIIDDSPAFWSINPVFMWNNIEDTNRPDQTITYLLQLYDSAHVASIDDVTSIVVSGDAFGSYTSKTSNVVASGVCTLSGAYNCDGEAIFRFAPPSGTAIWTKCTIVDNLNPMLPSYGADYSIRFSNNASTWTEWTSLSLVNELNHKYVYAEVKVSMYRMHNYLAPVIFSITMEYRDGTYSFIIPEASGSYTSFDTIDHLPSSLIDGESYYYRVQAYDGENLTLWSRMRRLTIVAEEGCPIPPSGLLTDGQNTPTRVVSFNPYLSWSFSDTSDPADTQAYARVQVGPSGQSYSLWDSGKVATASGVPYGVSGSPIILPSGLLRGTNYWWRVRTWDNSVHNLSSGFSDPATFRLNQLPSVPSLYAINRQPPTENPEYTVEFVTPSGSSTDESGSFDVEVVIHIPSSGIIYQDVDVIVSDTLEGTASPSGAAPSGDYSEWTDNQKTITFGYGTEDGATDTVSIDLLQDEIVEGDETIVLRIIEPSGKIGTNDTYTFTIKEDDVPAGPTLINAMNGKTTGFLNSYVITIHGLSKTVYYTTNMSGWEMESTGKEGWVMNPSVGYQPGEYSIMYNWGGWYIWDGYWWMNDGFDHFENATDGVDGIGFFDPMMMEYVHAMPV